MKNYLIAILLFITAHAQAQKTSLIHDDHVQIRTVGNYTALKVSSAIDLFLTQSSSNQVAVSAKDDETRNRIVTEVIGGILIIKMADQEGWWSWKRWSDTKAKAYVSIKELTALTASGATNIHLINKIQTPKIVIKLSGASDLKGDWEVGTMSVNLTGASEMKGNLVAKSLTLDASGASNVELAGEVEDISVEVSGASDAKLFNLNVKAAIVKASGASSANVNVSKLIKADASGASSIYYQGEAILKEKNSAGASSIKHKY